MRNATFTPEEAMCEKEFKAIVSELEELIEVEKKVSA
jgi:hypothetical protein